MYTSLHSGLMAIWNLGSIGNNRAPYTTGPRATKNGFIEFMKAVGVDTNGYIPAGVYIGMNNRAVTVVGNKTEPHEFVSRQGVSNKEEHYESMGMRHFSKQKDGQQSSCLQHIYLEYIKSVENNTLSVNSGSSESLELMDVDTKRDNIGSGVFELGASDPFTCGCPNTCNATSLSKKANNLPFSCEERVHYLMKTYGDSQSTACSAAVQGDACGPECDPLQCTQ